MIVKCPCEHCEVNIEFSTDEFLSGSSIPCPTCGKETTLCVSPRAKQVKSASLPPVLPSQVRLDSQPPSLPFSFSKWDLSKNKKLGVIVATVGGAVCCVFFTINDNGRDYREHPVAAIFGSITAALVVGGIWYFWVSRQDQKNGNETSRPMFWNAPQPTISDKFYDVVARELKEESIVDGLWTRAYSETGGDEAKTRALYIKYRVTQLAELAQHQFEAEKHEAEKQIQKGRETEDQNRPKMERAKRDARSNLQLAFAICLASTIYLTMFGLQSHDNSTIVVLLVAASCFGLASCVCFFFLKKTA
jgi:hypothetical protein